MSEDALGKKLAAVLSIVIAVVIVLIIFASTCIRSVPTGYTGILTTFGKVEDVVLQEGLHFKVPFVQKIVVVDNGNIIECGTPQELMELKGKYYRLVEIQSMSDKVAKERRDENFG